METPDLATQVALQAVQIDELWQAFMALNQSLDSLSQKVDVTGHRLMQTDQQVFLLGTQVSDVRKMAEDLQRGR
jgi:hypothetical protein